MGLLVFGIPTSGPTVCRCDPYFDLDDANIMVFAISAIVILEDFFLYFLKNIAREHF